MSGPSESKPDPVDIDPRVHIVNAATGEVRPVARDLVSGLDDFIASWRNDRESPDPLSFGGWQMVDDDHPAEGGRPAYRLVHKAIRTVFWPAVSHKFPNLRILFANGPVTVGEPKFRGTLPGRRAGTFLLPEWGEIQKPNGQRGVAYHGQPNMHLEIEGHQETIPATNYVEFLYELPPGDWTDHEDVISAGRAGTATLTAMIDFLFGPRVLGPVLAEEVGEVFDDWHWNRRLGGRTVLLESQTRLQHLEKRRLLYELAAVVEQQLQRGEEERNRLKVAAQWYWRGETEPDAVHRYIAYWLVVEALELGPNLKTIRPVKDAVRLMLDSNEQVLAENVGRLYGLRIKLVHGQIREVVQDDLERLRALAHALLEWRSLGTISPERLEALASTMGVEARRP